MTSLAVAHRRAASTIVSAAAFTCVAMACNPEPAAAPTSAAQAESGAESIGGSPSASSPKPAARTAPVSSEADAATATASLLAACRSGDLTAATLKELLDAGADVNAIDRPGGGAASNPALMVAAMNLSDREQIAPVLEGMIAAGADVNAQNGNGVTAASAGNTFNDHPEVVLQTLIDHGADPNLFDRNGNTLLFTALFANPCRRLVPIVLNGPIEVDVNHENNRGMTPLAYSITVCIGTSDLLLERGATADPDYRYRSGKTVLEIAISGDSLGNAGPKTLAYLKARAAGERAPQGPADG